MSKFKKVFSILLAGFIGISNLSVECQASDCVLFQDEKPQEDVAICDYVDCKEKLREILVLREAVKFISKEMGREKFYIPYLNKIRPYLNIALGDYVVFSSLDRNRQFRAVRIYKEIFLDQKIHFGKILYILGACLGDLRKKDSVKFEKESEKFNTDHCPKWCEKWQGIEVYD